MSELDYQAALLLQHKYEQEQKSTTVLLKSDEQLAQSLQEQYERENYVENAAVAVPNLVYDSKNKDSTRSLIDPSWELVDPTPDIHQLFILFDKQFFWNQLGSVCVSWSKRMTQCAGICSYKGKISGMCSITLSEPLLKLRPRKDLVETLLHEMIHAYLFITANDRDRDGHGPQFHKHMYRINKEAGTKISVYHSFHDEVRLYKQHWWRCNGPCQRRPPYFGMVKRAMNRAPGPNDRWWMEHSLNCGGSFIKVREPEKNRKQATDKKEPEKNSKKQTNKKRTKPALPDIRQFLPINNTKDKNPSTSSGITNQSVINTNSDGYSKDFLSVREHWLQKFNNVELNKKRPANSDEINGKQCKITKIDLPEKSLAIDFVNCPVCSEECLTTDLNNHLDMCLNKTSDIIDLRTDGLSQPIDENDRKQCPLCKSRLNNNDFDVHVEQCLIKAYDNVDQKIVDSIKNRMEIVNCLACNKKILKQNLNEHLDECMDGIFDKKTTNDDNTIEENGGKYNCPFCWQLIDGDLMKTHIDNCLENNSFINSEFAEDYY